MAEINYEKYLVKKPAYELIPKEPVKGRVPTMTVLSNDLVPGSNTYVEIGWISCMPDPKTHIDEHKHNYDEIILHLGIDPENPEELGAEIEMMVEGQPVTIDSTSAYFVPKGVKHGPLTWKRFDRAHIEMTIMLGAGTLAEADPGGHRQKRKE